MTFSRSNSIWQRTLSRSTITGAIAIFSLLSGVVPLVSLSDRSLDLNSSALAQSVSKPEIERYARTLLRIEPLRQTAYTNIKKILGSGQVPNIVCTQPNSMRSLPGEARQIAIDYCNQSKKISTENGLSPARFNAITSQAQSDANLRGQIQNELLKLQQ
ncbi:MAG: DUF4168 domain-containing protein [Cyanosarcina radialis HA8281-LM2]|jgi:hypothetical protein|nr:DUF4168 domain-containing protein [Cyanosarcina radialis HA8281-LM2]